MMTQPSDNYLSPYKQAQAEHGTGFGVTRWASERAQRLRFRVMHQMVFMAGKRVLDAGCSRGDFAAYLNERGTAYEHYVGVDALEQVTAFANTRGLPRCRFVTGDLLEDPGLFSIQSPQVIAVCGTLNTMADDAAIALLDTAWEAAGQTLVFNFLSDRATPQAPKQNGPARRLPTLKLLDWAMSKSPAVKLRQDYFRYGHDATIAMRKA